MADTGRPVPGCKVLRWSTPGTSVPVRTPATSTRRRSKPAARARQGHRRANWLFAASLIGNARTCASCLTSAFLAREKCTGSLSPFPWSCGNSHPVVINSSPTSPSPSHHHHPYPSAAWPRPSPTPSERHRHQRLSAWCKSEFPWRQSHKSCAVNSIVHHKTNNDALQLLPHNKPRLQRHHHTLLAPWPPRQAQRTPRQM